MIKIQVLSKGYHPFVGLLPKKNPFYVSQNTLGWLLAAGITKIRYFNPDSNKMENIDRKNYITECNHVFTKPIPPVISEEIYNKEESVPLTPTPPPSAPSSGGSEGKQNKE